MAGQAMRVCIVSENSYPASRGGLSEWAHMLLKTLPDVRFDVLCLIPSGEGKSVYPQLPNLDKVVITRIVESTSPRNSTRGTSHMPAETSRELARCLKGIMDGSPLDCGGLIRIRAKYPIDRRWLSSPEFWDSLTDYYSKNCSDEEFSVYFWSIYGVYSILLDNLSMLDKIPKADIYHALSSSLVGAIASLAATKHHKPLLLSEQGVYLKEQLDGLTRVQIPESMKKQIRRFSEGMAKTAYKYADAVVPCCHGHTVFELAMGVPPDRIHVVDNGIEIERFQPGPPRGDGPVTVGCFARVVSIKNILMLIKCAEIVLKKAPVNFIVVGGMEQEPGYYRECQELVLKLGIQDRFKFIGFANPVEWYHQVDIFVLSSISEGVPYALLEAMSCGLACVCTAVGGIPEILSDPSIGLTVPSGQPELLAEAILRLAQDRDLRLRMGQHAHDVAKQKYNIKQEAADILQIYKELVQGVSCTMVPAVETQIKEGKANEDGTVLSPAGTGKLAMAAVPVRSA